jgi:hypothetical protein
MEKPGLWIKAENSCWTLAGSKLRGPGKESPGKEGGTNCWWIAMDWGENFAGSPCCLIFGSPIFGTFPPTMAFCCCSTGDSGWVVWRSGGVDKLAWGETLAAMGRECEKPPTKGSFPSEPRRWSLCGWESLNLLRLVKIVFTRSQVIYGPNKC